MGIFEKTIMGFVNNWQQEAQELCLKIKNELDKMGYDTSTDWLSTDWIEYRVVIDKFKYAFKLSPNDNTNNLYPITYFTTQTICDLMEKSKERVKNEQILKEFKHKVLTPEGFAELVNEIINKNK